MLQREISDILLKQVRTTYHTHTALSPSFHGYFFWCLRYICSMINYTDKSSASWNPWMLVLLSEMLCFIYTSCKWMVSTQFIAYLGTEAGTIWGDSLMVGQGCSSQQSVMDFYIQTVLLTMLIFLKYNVFFLFLMSLCF